jgi:hypothetical protein
VLTQHRAGELSVSMLHSRISQGLRSHLSKRASVQLEADQRGIPMLPPPADMGRYEGVCMRVGGHG